MIFFVYLLSSLRKRLLFTGYDGNYGYITEKHLHYIHKIQ